MIVPTDPVPGDVNNHFHDDAEPWRSTSDGRWYTFASGGDANRSRGVNLLFSTTDEEFRSVGGGGVWREVIYFHLSSNLLTDLSIWGFVVVWIHIVWLSIGAFVLESLSYVLCSNSRIYSSTMNEFGSMHVWFLVSVLTLFHVFN